MVMSPYYSIIGNINSYFITFNVGLLDIESKGAFRMEFNDYYFEKNEQFKLKINSIIKSSNYKSCPIGVIKDHYLLLIDGDLYLFDVELNKFIIPLYKIGIRFLKENDYSSMYLEYSDGFPNYLGSVIRLNSHQGKLFNNFLNSLESFIPEFKQKIEELLQNFRYQLHPYFLTYYKKYYNEFNTIFLNNFKYLSFSFIAFESPKCLLSNHFKIQDFDSNMPKDIVNFSRIVEKKINISSNPPYINWIVLFGLRQIALELNINHFEQNYPTLINCNSLNITDLLLKLNESEHFNLFSKKNSSYFTMYFIGKNKLINRINIEGIIKLDEEVNKIQMKITSNKHTFLLEKELQAEREGFVNIPTYTITDIDLMNGIEFERFCGNLFEKLGYLIEYTKASGDQGIDIIANKGFQSIGIQVKRYSEKVTNKAVQEVVAGINHYKLQKGLVITNNYYTESAKSLAASNDVILWDRDVLELKIKETLK